MAEARRVAQGREGWTIQRIRKLVGDGTLKQPFRARHVNDALGITYAGTFLPKHCVGNPGGYTELFVRVSAGVYRLRTPSA